MDRGKTRKRLYKNIFNVPAYVINMKEREDRWRRFMDQPVMASMKKMKRSIAVNGQKLDALNDSRISVRTRLNIFRNYRRSHYEIATLGAVGCSLTHINAWKKFLATDSKMCLVFEDDAIVTESELNHISELIPTLPAKWGMWLLGCYRPNLIFEHTEKRPWNRVRAFTASHAYLITRDTAQKFLDDALPVETHIDHYMSSISVLKDIHIVQHPAIHIEFFKKERVIDSKTTTIDSNTSQHKKRGCPTCNKPDDNKQLYKSPTRKGDRGIRVKGLIHGAQPKVVLTLKHGATRRR